MSTFFKLCEEYFMSSDLYSVLGLSEKNAKENEVKKAYYKASLKVHPDRVAEADKDAATEKFKILSKVYSILSDKEKRAVYDETGEIDEENLEPEKDWDQYWRLLFKKISVSDIEQFEEKYKGSEEEVQDIKQAYTEGEGCMDYILENVLCATIEDEERFTKIIKSLIKKKELASLDKFAKQTKKHKDSRKRKAVSEAAEAEEMKKELGLGDGQDSLRQMILSRGKSREENMDNFLDSLAQKYGGSGKKGKAKKK